MSCPKYIFWENFVPKLESALFNLKLDIKGVLGCWFWIPKLFPYFFSLEYLFRANMVAILKSALFRMKIRSKRYSQVLISNSTIVFLSSVPKIPFSGQIWSPNFKVLFWKLEFGPKILECIVWTETWYKGAFKDVNSEFDNCFCKFGS